MKLQGNQNYTDSSKKRTEWVRESICISAPSKLLPLAASSLLLSVSGPVLYQGITKDQTCVLLGLLFLERETYPRDAAQTLMSCNLLALPKDGGGRNRNLKKTFRKCLYFFVFLKCFVYCFYLLKLLWAFSVAFNIFFYFTGPPRELSGKESTWQCWRPRLHPWVWKIPWRRIWQPTPVFLPGESR